MKRGLAFGCFDPFHKGHLIFLRACKSQCDHLTVCVHDDAYIRKCKNREPIFNEKERLSDIAELHLVDRVLLDPDRSRNEWIKELNIDIHFVSEEVPGTGFSCPTVRIPRHPGLSSTRLRGK